MIPPLVTVFLIVCAALTPRWCAAPLPQTTTPAIASIAAAIAPTGLEVRPGPQPEIAVVGIAPAAQENWTGVLSHRVAPDLQGYAGPIELLVGIDLEGRVTGVRILRHTETPTFVVGIEEPWFLDQFKGKTLDAPLKPGEDLDGITQATVTVETICEAVRRSLRFAALPRNPDGTRVSNPTSDQMSGKDAPAENVPSMELFGYGASMAHTPHLRSRSWRPWAALLGAAVLAAIGGALPRRLSALGHALLIGFAGTLFLSLTHLAMALREPVSLLRLPAFWQVFFVVALLGLLLKPRGYCRFICPCGRFQDAIGPVEGPAAPSSAAPLPNPAPQEAGGGQPVSETGSSGETTPRLPRWLGRTLLWSGLLALAVAPAFPIERLELFAPLFLLRADAFAALLIIAVFAGSLLVSRFYCHTLCPLDPLFADLERLRPRRCKPSSLQDSPASPAQAPPPPPSSPSSPASATLPPPPASPPISSEPTP